MENARRISKMRMPTYTFLNPYFYPIAPHISLDDAAVKKPRFPTDVKNMSLE